MSRQPASGRQPSRSWDPVAHWYAGWAGTEGSYHHRALAIPALLDLLAPRPGEHILDVGCGPGVLAPYVSRVGARLTGIDASRKLIDLARREHGKAGVFLLGDATRLQSVAGLRPGGFDAAVYLLSIQDIDPLAATITGAGWVLRPGGRVVIVMLHPCFRVPRQSGWGFDAKRSLQFRRVDRYLTSLDVPMQAYGRGRGGTTWSYHRPLGAYVDCLADAGLAVDRVREIPVVGRPEANRPRAARAAEREIPLFMAIRALKL